MGSPQGGTASIGADVIVGALPTITKLSTVGDTSAYALATTSCNVGDEELDWVESTNQHPVIAQNFFRLKDGRFEQIGLSWAKHGFCAVQGTLCGPCTPAGPGCISKLGVGCSDPYSTAQNGMQSRLGPRSQINPATGYFPYPFTAAPVQSTLDRRIQVHHDDLDPSLNPGALYFCEAVYIHPQDAAAGSGNNNASYRKFVVGAPSGGGYLLNASGLTTKEFPAIHAWQEHDPSVHLEAVDVPGDGRFLVGSSATEIEPGLWRYEYAVYNLNSDRAADSFAVPFPAFKTPGNVRFKDVHHHSGELYDTADWLAESSCGMLAWSAPSFDPPELANAIRWGTLYNFGFETSNPPIDALASLKLFKDGIPSTVPAAVLGPATCQSGDLDCNGTIDGQDLGMLLSAWGTPAGDLNADGTTDLADLALLLLGWP